MVLEIVSLQGHAFPPSLKLRRAKPTFAEASEGRSPPSLKLRRAKRRWVRYAYAGKNTPGVDKLIIPIAIGTVSRVVDTV
jgi:hypothetical protein